MKRTISSIASTLISASALVAHAQPGGSTGALPPVETQPAQPAPAPAPAPAEQPPAPAPAPAPAPTAPPPAAPQQPPPGYAQQPYPAPGYGYQYEPAPPPPPPEERPVRTVSLTMSPLHLLVGPILEGNIEVRPINHVGIAVIGGYGSIRVENSTGGGTTSFTAYELGGQLLFYPMEPFDKLVLGAELLYVHVDSDDVNDQNIRGVGAGYALGPLIGYKLITSGGFTFVAQGGVQYIFLEAEASDSSGNSDSESDSRWIPLLNLNIGWSF